jgi:nucleolar complex protein 2
VLKASYLSFARNAKYYTLGTAQEVVFMRNSVVELYRLAPSSSYQLAFVYIRQVRTHVYTYIYMCVCDIGGV